MSLPDSIVKGEFWRALPAEVLQQVEDLAQIRDYSAGTILFLEGSLHPEFHLLAEGHVRLDMLVPNRGRVPILTVGPGDILAWSALLGEGIMTASAVAMDRIRTVAIPGDDLRRLCDQYHTLGFHFMLQLAKAVSHRLVATRLQLLDLFGEHVPVLDMVEAVGRPGDPEC